MSRAGRVVALSAVALLLAGCRGDDGAPAAGSTTTDSGPTAERVAAALCEATPVVVESRPPDSTDPGRASTSTTAAGPTGGGATTASPPTVEASALTELSGLVASRQVEDRWWAVNDSGNEGRLYALGPNGEDVGSVAVPSAANVDWEDLAVGPGPDGDLLYIGDIGNNTGDRDTVPVEVVVEPDATGGLPSTVSVERTVELTWPDGARDAEVLLVDPRSSTLVIITKSFFGRSEVYTADGTGRGRTDLEKVGTVDLREAASVPSLDAPVNVLLGLGAATAGDVTAAGDAVMVRTYGTALVWPRRRGQTLAEAIVENEPCEAPTEVEAQGEAIAVAPGAGGYRTIGEGGLAPVNRFAVPDPALTPG